MKNTVIYHSADFDGEFCYQIAKKFLGAEDTEYIGWNFGDPVLPIPTEGTIYVMDLPIDRVFGFDFSVLFKDGFDGPKPYEFANLHIAISTRMIWIDHHKTSIDTHPATIPGYRIDGVAACRLAWQWFSGNGSGFFKEAYFSRNVVEPIAVRMAGEYDVWDKRDPAVDLFQFGLRAQYLTEDHWKALLSFNGVPLVEKLVERGQILHRYQRQQDAEHIKRAFELNWEGLNFICYNGRGNSLTFESIQSGTCDAFMLIHFNGQSWMVSMYHAPWNKGIDLSEIAKKYGGGGHRGACGFTTNCGALPFLKP